MRTIVVVTLITIFCASPVMAQQVSIQELMTQQQFRVAGLQKLSPQELAALDRWLTEFAVELIEISQTAAPTPTTNSSVIESRINGEFTGWTGETIFRLQNGQIWQQSSYAYMYRYAYSPGVLIYASGSRFKMRVDGVDSEIFVTRLR
jgi:hypothetical protein